MRRASAQAWLASARSQPPLSQLSTRINARSAAILTCAGRHSAGLLSTARPSLRAAFTTTAASTTLRRLGLSGVAQPLRAGLRSKTLPGGRRNYSAEAPTAPETAKAAETPVSLEVLRAEFYKFERKLGNWKIGGVQVPTTVLWLMFFQFLGLPLYSDVLEHNYSVRFIRWYVERLEYLGLLQGDDDDDPLQTKVPGFTRDLTVRERATVHSVVYVAALSAIAFLWARGRTRRSFNEYIHSRAVGETTGTYPITMENVVYKSDITIGIKGEGLKSVRREVVRQAGLKAVQASVGLVLASAASSYALTTWVDSKMKDGVIRFRRSDVLQGETALSLILLFNFFVSWAVLIYQPYTIFPFFITNFLMPRLRFTTREYKLITPPAETPVEAKLEEVVEVGGGKEYITVTEKKSGPSYSRTESCVFVPHDDADAHAHAHAHTQRSLDTTTKTDA